MLDMRRQLGSSHGIRGKHSAAEIDYEAEEIADSCSPLVQPTHRDSRSLLPGLPADTGFDDDGARLSGVPMLLDGLCMALPGKR